MIKPVFIVGLPRTGSTLWSNVIAKNPDIMRFGEMHFLNPFHKDFRYFLKEYIGDLSVDSNVEKLVSMLFSGREFRGLRGNYWMQIQRVEPGKLSEKIFNRVITSDRRLSDIFKALVEESSLIRGHEHCLIKFPVYGTYMATLRSWYPDAKILHITRDPRATAVSKMSDPGGTAKRIEKYPYLTTTLQGVSKASVTAQYILTSYSHKKIDGDRNYALYRYEDLLLNPKWTIARLCDFLDIEFKVEMLRPKEGQPSSITGDKSSGFQSKHVYNWKDRLPSWQEKVIRHATKGSMRRLGYSPDYCDQGISAEKL